MPAWHRMPPLERIFSQYMRLPSHIFICLPWYNGSAVCSKRLHKGNRWLLHLPFKLIDVVREHIADHAIWFMDVPMSYTWHSECTWSYTSLIVVMHADTAMHVSDEFSAYVS
jgi:hypothetical protein